MVVKMTQENQGIRGKLARFEDNEDIDSESLVKRDVEKDAERVLFAILSKRENPRARISPGRVYFDIVSQYNGSRSLLDNAITRMADNCGLKGIQVLIYLNDVYENFERQRKELGDTREYANELETATQALEACASANASGAHYPITDPSAVRDARKILETGYFRKADTRFDEYFAEA